MTVLEKPIYKLKIIYIIIFIHILILFFVFYAFLMLFIDSKNIIYFLIYTIIISTMNFLTGYLINLVNQKITRVTFQIEMESEDNMLEVEVEDKE